MISAALWKKAFWTIFDANAPSPNNAITVTISVSGRPVQVSKNGSTVFSIPA